MAAEEQGQYFRSGRFPERNGKCILFRAIIQIPTSVLRRDGFFIANRHCLDINLQPEYSYLMKGGTDSELSGSDDRGARKSKFLFF